MIRRSVMLLVIVAASRANAQSAVVLEKGEKGEKAYGASAGLLTNDDATLLAVGADYVKDGWIDVGLLLGRYGFDNEGFGGADVSAIGIQPGVQLHFLQDGSAPVSAYGAASIQYLRFSENIPNADLSGWSFTLAGGAYRAFPITPKVRAVPQAQLYYTSSRGTMSTPFGDTTSSEDTVGLAMIGNFAFASRSGTEWIVAPQLDIDDDHVTFGIFGGAVFAR